MSEQKQSNHPAFLPGLVLARELSNVVQPILAESFPSLEYSAALVGPGSDVLGFDTPMSMDHDWGPRLLLFVPDDAEQTLAATIHGRLSETLPVDNSRILPAFRTA